jgi:FkbM family methyltransferase
VKDDFFVLHHVGARNGFRSFPRVQGLEHEFISVMYEAAKDDNERILRRGGELGTKDTILVNACVGRSKESVLFNLNQDPYTSSFLPLNPKYAKLYSDQNNRDYVLGEAALAVKQESMTTDSLDELSQSLDLPQCDFLSLDTQGSELDILKGADITLNSCVGLQLEVAFVEVYKGQPLFSDIDAFLRSKGFVFVKFTGFQEYAPLVTGVESRGEKMHVFADAIYFRSSDLLMNDQFYPFVFTALCFGQTEVALDALKGNFNLLNKSGSKDWMRFCEKFVFFSSAANKLPLLSNSVFKADTSNLIEKGDSETNSNIRNWTYTLRRSVRPQSIFQFLPKPMRSKIMKQLSKVRRWRTQRFFNKEPYSELELLFVRVGLINLANVIKKSRLSASN